MIGSTETVGPAQQPVAVEPQKHALHLYSEKQPMEEENVQRFDPLLSNAQSFKIVVSK